MINAPVLRAVQDLLRERGYEQRENERLGDFVARGLGISEGEAEMFLQLVHDGVPVEEAAARAGIPEKVAGNALLTDIARAIGTALGRVSRT
jgi:hypothetical protein